MTMRSESPIVFAHYGHLWDGKRDEKTEVHLYYLFIAGLLLVCIVGGKPHIGAITFFSKRGVMQYEGTFRFPKHRDDVLTREAVKIFSSCFAGPVLVMAGVHYKKPSMDEIAAIVGNSRRLCKRLVNKLYTPRRRHLT